VLPRMVAGEPQPMIETNAREVIARLEREGWSIEHGKEHDILHMHDIHTR